MSEPNLFCKILHCFTNCCTQTQIYLCTG